MRTWGINAVVLAVIATLASPALAAIDPNSGIDFVAIGAVNNPAWTGGGRNDNRGSVGYVYNIGKYEVTTVQWVEFFNAVLDRPTTDRIPHVIAPFAWGAARVSPTTPGATRYGVIPGLDMYPVNGISWRTAAIYANWLHNDKATNRDAFLNGAYDVSTFGPGPENIGFVDQLTHNPGARYWIPTQDEWMKAAHYDPNRPNADGTIGGWWSNANSSDSFPAYGPVGVRVRTNFPLGPDPNGPLASANAAWGNEFPGYWFEDIPLGAYENALSPWGLYDTAGGTSELTEGYLAYSIDGIPRVRYADGTAMGIQSLIGDEAGAVGATVTPFESRPGIGLRMATSVPTPSSFALSLAALAFGSRRKRRACVIVAATLAAPALAAIDPNSGIDFVTVGAVNNPAWTGGGSNNNRGSVGYVYNIGKYEVTTAQWVEFFNAVLDRPTTDRIPFVAQPYALAATRVTPTTPGAIRYSVIPGRDMFPVNGISWRTAAIYCNWLHNGKATNRDAFLNGAYDVSTFGPGPENIGFVDQLTHNPGARYWIPTQDEWMKAAHYDPAKPNADGTTGGWWTNANSSDSFPAYGPVGVHARTNFPLGPDPNGPLASANAGWTTEFPGYWLDEIPLGAYESALSPWGLYDTAGGTSELTEGYLAYSIDGIPRFRYADGSAMGVQYIGRDLLSSPGATVLPYEALPGIGLRLATSVPTPSSLALSIAALAFGSRRKRRACVIVAATLATPTLAAIDPNSGIDFVTVGAVNNPAWTGANSYNNGRGSVGYEYNIGKFEVTTAQWVEFLNAAFDRPSNDQIPHVIRPSVFSGFAVPGNNGGVRWTVPAGTEMRGVGGITWRTAAVYANWLHNGKSTDRAAFLSGAYDVSTFGYVQGIGYTDQLTRSPGAQYWIPSLDEWLKAAHYDPNKANPDGSVGGWWTYSNGTDTPVRYGPPEFIYPEGPAQANATFFGPSNPYLIPLGSYPDTTSPFGLLDVAGMTSEWTEEPYAILGTITGRISDGSAWAVYAGTNGVMDNIAAYVGTPAPNTVNAIYGLRIASSVPTPGAWFVGVTALTYSTRRRRT